ncbi:enoyl-CoA hydratase/isomerase family protein [Halalkalibacter wakoensis]|nr:enoyl-CoA hydratase-related protein [Halalkalibacter wakoensis]
MNSLAVRSKVENQVATITLNRPEVKNALNKALLDELHDLLQSYDADDTVRVVVIQGCQGAFSAGADLKSIPIEDLQTFDYGTFLEETYNRLIRQIVSMKKPTVAHINGIAVGAGLSIALACDYRVASKNATLGLGFMKIGLVPDAGASYFLPRLIGLGNAMELALGKLLSAEEARQIQLVTQVEGLDLFLETVKSMPFTAFSLMKQNFHQSFQSSLHEVLQMEVDAQRKAGESKEHKAAIAAFLNMRK